MKLYFILLISGLMLTSCDNGGVPSSAFDKALGYSCSGAEFQKVYIELSKTGYLKKFYLDRKLGKKNLSRLLISSNKNAFSSYDAAFNFDAKTASELMKGQASLFKSSDIIEKKELSKTDAEISGCITLEREGAGKCRLLYKYNTANSEITSLFIAAKGSDDFAKGFEVFSENTRDDLAVEVTIYNDIMINGVQTAEKEALKLIQMAAKKKNVIFIPHNEESLINQLAIEVQVPFEIFTLEKTYKANIGAVKSEFTADLFIQSDRLIFQGSNLSIEELPKHKETFKGKRLLLKASSRCNWKYLGEVIEAVNGVADKYQFVTLRRALSQ